MSQISIQFKELTGLSITEFAKSVGLTKSHVSIALKRGYCPWPRIKMDGRYYHEAYWSYKNMIKRCYDPKTISYKYYGAKGVKVCESWRKDFWQFVKDVGSKPGPNYTIDRIDTKGQYEPGNCTWANKEEQANNRTNQVRYENKTLKQLATEMNINYSTIRNRYRRTGTVHLRSKL